MTAALAADYLQAIGYPPEASAWPDSRFYPRHVSPRVWAFLNRYAREQHGRPLPEQWRGS